ncbi:MAG: NUDIX domain-containing protein [Flavobacteriaceae bacterium]|nr:NUDIX domain-containing protein [Flavobacteriaceae bacterium]
MSLSTSLNPHVSVDCSIFGLNDNALCLLLINRNGAKSTFQNGDNRFGLPGDLVRDNENLDEAADRILRELTGLSGIFLHQFKAFGDPLRIAKAKDRSWLEGVRQEPDARVITLAYLALIDTSKVEIKPGSFTKEAKWVPISEIKDLVFDHNEIFEAALLALREMIQIYPIAFKLLPLKFTMGDLQSLYEIILEREVDKRNFRRKMLHSGLVRALTEKQYGVSNKPARFYVFNGSSSEELYSSIVNLKMEGSITVFN